MGLDPEWIQGRVFDYNGDGRTDWLRWAADTWWVVQWTGNGFALLNTSIEQRSLQLVDVNGDGLQDAVIDDGGNWSIRINTGGQFDTPLATNQPADNWQYAQAIDYNADGREDLLVPYSGYWRVLQATAAGRNFDPPKEVIADTGYQNGSRIGDFNGDGFQDFALDYGAQWHLLFHQAGTPDLITTIDAGGDQFDDLIKIAYRPLTDSEQFSYGEYAAESAPQFANFYTLTDPDPGDSAISGRLPRGVVARVRGIIAPIYVTTSYQKSNGVGGMRQYTYRYQDAWAELTGRGFLGFAKVIVNDLRYALDTTDDRYSVSTYAQDFPYTGSPIATEVRGQSPTGTPLSSASSEYAQVVTENGEVPARFVYLQNSSQARHDPDTVH